MTVIAPRTIEKARRAVADALGRPIGDLDDERVLTELVVESFALVEAVIRVQESLGIHLIQEDLRAVSTVGDLVAVCAARLDGSAET